jgi:nucleotide-binding universal stress UspA family protein
MFAKVLVPLDGSPLGERAISHAASVAHTFGSTLLLLRVIPVRQRGGAVPLDIIDRRLGHAEAGAYLDAIAADLRGRGLTVETAVTEGQPAEQIVDVLRRHGADLVVLTSHGCGGSTEFPISGTAHKVVSRAGTSVLMVPPPERASSGVPSGTAYRRILVGLDGSRRGDWSLGPAAALARQAGAELLLVHVVQVPETVEEPRSAELREAADQLVRLNSQAAARHLAQVKARLESPELHVRTRIEVSRRIPEALANLAEAERADLVVLTAHGTSITTHGLYGAIAVQVLAEARRPLLVAQDVPSPLEGSRTGHAVQRETAVNHL